MSHSLLDKDARITMHMLGVLSERQNVSQRGLALELGIALGATNAYIRKCMSAGLIQKTPAPLSRHGYRLTPRGLMEKIRLNGEFLKKSMEFYRTARTSCDAAIAQGAERGFTSLYIFSVDALAEVALLSVLNQARIGLSGFLAPEFPQSKFMGQPVVRAVHDLAPNACILFGRLNNALPAYNALRRQINDDNKLLVPDILANTLIALPKESPEK